MIISNQWYNIARTSTLGSTTGIRIEFGSHYALIAVAVDYGNVVITAVESNIGEEKIKVGARIRYNRGWHADVRISPAIEDADLKVSVYENNGWTAVSPNTSTTGTTVCIIDDIDSLIQHTGSGDSLWEKVNIGTKEAPIWGLRPKDIDNTLVGIFSDTFVTAGGRSGSDNSPSNLFTRLDSWDNYDETAGDVLSALLGYGLKQDIEALKKSGLLDESKLKAYLDKYNYLTKAAADLLYAPINSGGLWDKVNIGTEEAPVWAVRPKDIDNTVAGIVSDTFITAGGHNGNSSGQGATTLGGLNNVDSTADDLQTEDVVLVKGVDATHWTLRALSTLGLNKTELESYLTTNSYLKKDTADGLYAPLASFNTLNTKVNDFLTGTDTDSIINKWKELEAFLAGQTETSTLADLLAVKADKTALQAHIDNYNYFIGTTYAAHISAYNTHITEYNSFKTDTQRRLTALEALWAIDEENNGLYPKSGRGIWSESYITAGGIGTSAGAGGLIQNVYGFNSLGGTFDNTVLTDTFNAYTINYLYTEVEKLKSGGTGFSESAMWTALGGSETNKVIASEHVPDLSGKYLPLINAKLSSSVYNGALEIQRTGGARAATIKFSNVTDGVLGSIGIGGSTTGVGIQPYWNDGSSDYTFIHTGNIGSYNAGSATKLQTARTIWGQNFDGTSGIYANDGLLHSTVGSYGLSIETQRSPFYGVKTYLNWDEGSTEGVCRIATGNAYQGLVIGFSTGNNYAFTAQNTYSYTDAVVIKKNGNVLIGTTTDAGYKFTVDGAALANTIRTQELRLGEAEPSGGITQNKWYYASITYEYTDAAPATRKPDVVFKTMRDTYAEGTGVERMRIKSNGNVGIGITNPAYTLDVAGIGRFTNNSYGVILAAVGNTIDGYNAATTNANLYLNYAHAGNVYLVIGGGSVGIGTTSSAYKLNVAGTLNAGATTVASLTSSGNISATGGTILGYTGRFFEVMPRTDGSSGVYNLGSSDNRWTAYLKSADISGNIRLKPASADYGNYLYFGDGSYCYIAELSDDKMTIYASSGLQITANTNVSGNVYATGQIAGGQASDRKLKDDIQSMTDIQATKVLKSLRPVTFRWNGIAKELGNLIGYSDGFIADEYEILIPNSGRAIWNDYRAISYERTAGYLVKGWQNHETRLARLERENRELKAEVEELKKGRA